MRIRWIAVALIALPLVACDEKPAADATVAGSKTAAEAAPADDKAEPDTAKAEPDTAKADASAPMLVSTITVLRKVASDDRKIDDPAGGAKKVNNWVATLQRGERVLRLEPCAEWCKVEAAGGQTGFIKARHLIEAQDVSLATVLAETPVFRRPDLVALDTGRKLEPGTLVFVTRDQDGFSEVNYLAQATVWLQKDKLSSDSREVEASRLLGKIRWMQENKEAGAEDLLKLLTDQFGDATVVAVATERMAAQEAEAAAAAAAGDDVDLIDE